MMAATPTPQRKARFGRPRAWPFFATTLRSIIFTKKAPLLALTLLIPLVVTFILIPFLDEDYSAFDGAPHTAEEAGRLWFEDSVMILYLGVLIPLVTAFYATGLIGDEVANKTLPYLFTRPVPRWRIYLYKYAAFLVAVFGATAVAVTLVSIVATAASSNPLQSLDTLAVCLLVVFLATAAFGGLFGLIGVSLKFPIVFAIMYFFLWENVLGNFPGQIRRFTVLFYARNIISDHAGRTNFESQFLGLTVEPTTAYIVLALVAILSTAAAAWVVRSKDYNV
jgi:ABC-type transport system involved in multi-copper enzyme maturation permease subunit